MSERLEGFTTIEELKETFSLDPRFLSAYLAAEDVDQMIEIAEDFETHDDPRLAQDIEEARTDIVRATVADELEQAGVGAIANDSLDSFFGEDAISAYDSFEGIRDTAFMRGVAELEDDITETFRDFPAAVAIAGGCYRADSLDTPCHAFIGKSWVDAARTGGIDEAMREAYSQTLDREPATEAESARRQEEQELEKTGKEKDVAYSNLDTVEGAAQLAADVEVSVLDSSSEDRYFFELTCAGQTLSTSWAIGNPLVTDLLYSAAVDADRAARYDLDAFAAKMGFINPAKVIDAYPSEAISAYEGCERARDWFRDALGIDNDGVRDLIDTLEHEEEVDARVSAIQEERAAARSEAIETKKPTRDQWLETTPPARKQDTSAPSPVEDARAFRAQAASIDTPARERGRAR